MNLINAIGEDLYRGIVTQYEPVYRLVTIRPPLWLPVALIALATAIGTLLAWVML